METIKNNINKPMVLIGMMGAGKTTIGELLAKKHDLSWVDTDRSIESTSGQDIPEIFEIYGEQYFRQLESKALENALASSQVISSGGGMVTVDANHRLLKDAYVIYLKANIETLVARLPVTNRPLLKNVDVYTKLTSLLENRAELYEKNANLIIETDNLSPDDVVEVIEQKISS
jgi:shikimate kinase